MKKILTYILLTFYVFFSGNFWVFLQTENYIPEAHAATTTLSYAGTANDLSDSTQFWITPGNATGDTTGTSANMDIADRDTNTNTLALTNFDLTGTGLPSGATINGIQVEVEWQVENRRVQDLRVQLTKNGTTGIGNNYANNAAWPTTKTITSYGGLTDLWGTSWTAAELQSANFWVLLQYVNTRNRDRVVDVYRVRVTIDYSLPNTPPTNITLSGSTINEWLPAWTSIGTFSTTDPDIGDTHSYSFNCATAGADDGNFTISGTTLQSGIIFDHDSQTTHNICVRTNDGNGGTFDKNFTININEVLIATPGWVWTNLNLWLKADAGTSTTTDGAALLSWDDQSGNGLNASAVTAPNYRNNVSDSLNFNPIIDFNGVDGYMNNLANGADSDSYYIVIVPDTDVEGTTSQGVPFGFDCPSGTLSSGTCWLDFGGLALGAFTTTIPDEVITHAIGSSANWRSSKTAVITYPAGEPMLIWVNDNAASSTSNIYEKWEQVDNTTRNSYQTLANADYSLWRSPDDGFPYYFDGKIAEVINYDGGLTEIQRHQIESYLAVKYGITLNSGTQDYIASDGTSSIWSTLTAGVYTNNIFGIGRDDGTELWQVQSKSVNNDAIITLHALWEGTNIANSFTDIQDKEFLTLSHNNGSNTWTNIGLSWYYTLERQWRIQETGDTGDLDLDIDMWNTIFDVPALSAGTTYYAVYDSDNDDTLSDETPIAMTNIAGDLWRLSGINLENEREFTIATEASANSIPTNIILSNTTLTENTPSNTSVWTLTSTDADIWDTHSYNLVSGTGDNDNARFSLSGSTLQINHSPDYEIQNSYSIRVQSDDGAWGQYQKDFTISITDVWETVSSVIDFEDIEDINKYTVASGQWNRTTSNPFEGIYSLESDNLGANNTQSCFEIDHTFSTLWAINFYYNVSSELGSDFLSFYINDIEQWSGWSGTVPWTQYISSDIDPGSYNYKWCYTKDNAGSAGSDTAFVDLITFPNSSVDTVAPSILSTNFASGSLLPGWNHSVNINYSDTDSGIDISSASFEIFKWDWISSYWADIAPSNSTSWSISTSQANYTLNNLSAWRYRYIFEISDNEGNSNSETLDFYIDIPEFAISDSIIDIGDNNAFTESYSNTITLTVKTLWAWFDLTANMPTPDLIYTPEIISPWNGSRGFGVSIPPYNSISPIWNNQVLFSEAQNINTNWDLNTYSFDLKLWALIENSQASWEYLGNIDFGIELNY